MAKKSILNDEEELISYQIVKNKKKQMILLNRSNHCGYIVHTQDIRKVKFFHQRFILSVFVYLSGFAVLKLGEFISLTIAALIYGLAELAYRFLFLKKLKKVDLSDEEISVYDSHPEMINYLRSTCVTKIMLYLSFIALTILHLSTADLPINDLIAAVAIIFVCTVMTSFIAVKYFQLTKKGKGLGK